MSALPPVGRTTTRSGATRSEARVELTVNLRVVVELRPWSSSTEIVRVQRPSAGGSGVVGWRRWRLTLRRRRRRQRQWRERHADRSRLARHIRLLPGDRPVGGGERRRHGRRADDLVRELLGLGDTVTVRRDDGLERRRGEDAVVLEHERGRDGPLPPVRRRVQHLPVEGERRRSAAVQLHSTHGSEPRQRQRHLVRGHPDRVPGLPPVDDDEDQPPVGELPDCRTRGRGAI